MWFVVCCGCVSGTTASSKYIEISGNNFGRYCSSCNASMAMGCWSETCDQSASSCSGNWLPSVGVRNTSSVSVDTSSWMCEPVCVLSTSDSTSSIRCRTRYEKTVDDALCATCGICVVSCLCDTQLSMDKWFRGSDSRRTCVWCGVDIVRGATCGTVCGPGHDQSITVSVSWIGRDIDRAQLRQQCGGAFPRRRWSDSSSADVDIVNIVDGTYVYIYMSSTYVQ